jgi:hypothetical protein
LQLYEAGGSVTVVVGVAPEGAKLVGADGMDDGSVTVVGGVAAGGAKLVGATGKDGVTGGAIGGATGGVTGIVGGAIGVTGDFGDAGGASAAILLVRNTTLLSRAFNAFVDSCCRPPAAGSISRFQAPHLCTEST